MVQTASSHSPACCSCKRFSPAFRAYSSNWLPSFQWHLEIHPENVVIKNNQSSCALRIARHATIASWLNARSQGLKLSFEPHRFLTADTNETDGSSYNPLNGQIFVTLCPLCGGHR
jgi:hypothetical protein